MTEIIESAVEAWEPGSYGFCAYNETERKALAQTLEALRRRVCAYGGGTRCDCKYGLTVADDVKVERAGAFGTSDNGIRVTRFDSKTRQHVEVEDRGASEQTGCPELREIIHRLLHRDVPLI